MKETNNEIWLTRQSINKRSSPLKSKTFATGLMKSMNKAEMELEQLTACLNK